MKLNPPETAPLSRVIIGHFKNRKNMVLTIWDAGLGRWFVPIFAHEYHPEVNKVKSVRLFNPQTYLKSELLGWLPMPKIDDEGNVI